MVFIGYVIGIFGRVALTTGLMVAGRRISYLVILFVFSYFRNFTLLMREAGVQRMRNQKVRTSAHRIVIQEAGDRYLSLGFLLVC